ncbi:NAD(P)H-dependent flavin oxidoreductase [Paradevosia shaoguanensis]|uniref:NAD(P)H-dependent flavin oxidoreductase n=1 Tax=Paradevosia shaoguanensis TaxID=1335043 RepID=UPI0019326798|nr:nitronate monooxygenase [Paradevosia shaoguanensis]
MKLHTDICAILKCRYPIVLAGMGGVARFELASAVTHAGGFAFMGMVREPEALIRTEVQRMRKAGHEHFGINVIPAATDPALLDRQIGLCIDLGVPVVGLFWEIDRRVVERLRKAGVMVTHQVGSAEEAIEVEDAGAQIIIAQGVEAGGHVRGNEPLGQLLPKVVEAVSVPVLAAGGIARGADIVTALALGAQGVVLGTALMATREAFAHDYHKERLVAANGGDTRLTADFHVNWPAGAKVRVLGNSVTSGRHGSPFSSARIVIGHEDERPIYRFSTDSPLKGMSGQFEEMALYAGTGVGEISDIPSAGERMRRLVAEASDWLGASTPGTAESSSPVCYAGEIHGVYLGYIEGDELQSELAAVAGQCGALLRAYQRGRRADGLPPFDIRTLYYARAYLALTGWLKGRQPVAAPVLAGESAELAVERLEEGLALRLGALNPRVGEDGLRSLLSGLLASIQVNRRARNGAKPLWHWEATS